MGTNPNTRLKFVTYRNGETWALDPAGNRVSQVAGIETPKLRDEKRELLSRIEAAKQLVDEQKARRRKLIGKQYDLRILWLIGVRFTAHGIEFHNIRRKKKLGTNGDKNKLYDPDAPEPLKFRAPEYDYADGEHLGVWAKFARREPVWGWVLLFSALLNVVLVVALILAMG